MQEKKLLRSWLWLALLSLAISGFYSIFIVLLRSPLGNYFTDTTHLFRTMLVVHVDLSVLVWMVSSIIIAGLYYSLSNKSYNVFYEQSQYIALLSSAGGVLLIIISPFFYLSSKVFINNYVPILYNIYFIIGLCIFISGAALQLCNDLLKNWRILKMDAARLAISSSALITLVSIASWFFTAKSLQYNSLYYHLDLESFFEITFWGGGHILQFAYTSIVMAVWIILIERIRNKKLPQAIFKIIIVLNSIFALSALYIFNIPNLVSNEQIQAFTLHMKYLGGIAPSLCILFLIPKLFVSASKLTRLNSLLRATIICSMVMFISGGFIGLLISGSNVTIPAHYHGSIIGISIALMGLVYAILSSQYMNLMFTQLNLYTIGQLLHIIGLAWSGGYGVLRKTPGVEMSLNVKIAMGMMGIGGLLAIIGGLLFVWLAYKMLVIFKQEPSNF